MDQGEKPNLKLPLRLAWMAFFAIGSSSLLAFRDWVVANPGQAAGLGGLYLIAGAAAWFVGQMWKRLGATWLDRIARTLNFWIECWVDQYYRRYLRYLAKLDRESKVEGTSQQNPEVLELTRVYVDLRIASGTPGPAAADLMRRLPDDVASHSLWDYLAAADEGLSNLVILGPPGSGKTTLLRHIVVVLARDGQPPVRRSRDRQKVGVCQRFRFFWALAFRRRTTHRFPILIPIRDLEPTLKGPITPSLARAAKDGVKPMKRAPPVDWFERKLGAGRCLVLLDGFDEVPDAHRRQEVAAWIDHQIDVHGSNRFVVTSRHRGYWSAPLAQPVSLLEVMNFTAAQVEQFVTQWYRAAEIKAQAGQDDPEVRDRAETESRKLMALLRRDDNATLWDLAINPLLLTLIATVHRNQGDVPRRRSELYADICRVFLGKRDRAKGIQVKLTPHQRQLVLQTIAYALMLRRGGNDESQHIPEAHATGLIADVLHRLGWQEEPAMFLKDVEAGSGLFQEKEPGRWFFAHLSFQEYLAACHIKEQQRGQDLVGHIGSSWWHETIRLYCAQADASEIVRVCLADDQPEITHLVLAQDIEDEAQTLDADLRHRLTGIIEDGLDCPDPERRRLAAEVRLRRRLREFQRLDDNRAIDPGLITCAEYQLFVDDKAAQNKFRQPDHWSNISFARGTAREPILGVRGSDASEFCDWLTQKMGGQWHYRLPARMDSDTVPLADDGSDRVMRHWVLDSDNKPILSHPLSPQDWARTGLENRPLCLDTLFRELAHCENIPALDAPETRAVLQAVLETSAQHSAVHDFARTLDSALAGAFARALARATDHTLDRAFDLATDLDRTLAFALGLDVTLDVAFDVALDRARTLALDRAFALDVARDLDSDLALDFLFLWIVLDSRAMAKIKAYDATLSTAVFPAFLCNDIPIRVLALYELTFAASVRDTEPKDTGWSRHWTDFPASIRAAAAALVKPRRRPQADVSKDPREASISFLKTLWHLRERLYDRLQPFEGLRLARDRKAQSFH